MADLTTSLFSRTSRNLPNRDAGIPELPAHPIGWGETGKANWAKPRVELQVLIEAASLACDHHGDGPEAREQMRRDCIEAPPHLRADLRDHFKQTYGDKP